MNKKREFFIDHFKFVIFSITIFVTLLAVIWLLRHFMLNLTIHMPVSTLSAWCMLLTPYLFLGVLCLPAIVAALLYGWFQIFLIIKGLIDMHMIHDGFLSKLFYKFLAFQTS